MLLMGFPIMALEVSAITLFQTVTEDRFRGRVFGIYGTVSGVLLLLGRGIATLVGGQVNVSMLMARCRSYLYSDWDSAFRLLRDPANPLPSHRRAAPRNAQPGRAYSEIHPQTDGTSILNPLNCQV